MREDGIKLRPLSRMLTWAGERVLVDEFAMYLDLSSALSFVVRPLALECNRQLSREYPLSNLRCLPKRRPVTIWVAGRRSDKGAR